MAILTNKNALKKALTVILCILLAIFMPVIAIVSFFSGGISVDTAGLSQKIEAQLTAEERAKISKAEELLKKVESEMKKKKYTDDQILQSRVITVLFLQDKVSDKDFVKKLVGCFKKDQTTKNLISKEIKLPCGKMCGHNCADGCIYWNPYDRDSNGRQYCSHYGHYYYPRERQGCLSYK